jgi:cell division septum initiation protein DivIVA
MAFHFLSLSKTYLEKADNKLQRIREVVCSKLKDSYKVMKGRDDVVFSEVKSELEKVDILLLEKDYRDAKMLLRGLYLWLRATNEEERAVALLGKAREVKQVLDWLRQDGIQSWKDVARLAPMPTIDAVDEETEPEEEVDAIPIDRRARLRELGAGEETLDLLDRVTTSFQAVLEENQKIRDMLEESEAELAVARIEVATAKDYLILLEEDNESLELRIKAAQEAIRKAHVASLEEIAKEHPEIPNLFSYAERIRAGKGWRERQQEELVAHLPSQFNWTSESGTIQYQDRFLRILLKAEEGDRDRIIRQLQTLATQGPEYASLNTRKNDYGRIPFSPRPCFTSRATDEWRFSWTKEVGTVTLYWLYRKSETVLSQSES